MANIRINSLPPEVSPSASDVVAIDGVTTRKATLTAIVDSGRPLANQAEAEAGTDPAKAMTPLTTAQAIAAQGATQFASTAQGATADSALQPSAIGVTIQPQGATLTSLEGLPLAAGDILYSPGPDAIARLPAGADGQVLLLSGGLPEWSTATGLGDLLSANNLDDLDNADTALTNLGFGATGKDLAASATADDGLTALGFGAAGKAVAASSLAADVRDYLDAAPYVADYAALKAVDTTKDQVVTLTEEYRGGQFYRRAADLSATLTPALGTSTSITGNVVTLATHHIKTGDALMVPTAVNGLSTGVIYYGIRLTADTYSLAASHANAYAGTAITLTGTTNFEVRRHLDPLEAVYVISTGDAIDGSDGAFVRKMTDGFYHMDWAGARTASDILPIFDGMKHLAAGATLQFGAHRYITSNTLFYEAIANKPCWITGVSAEETIIANTSTGKGFTIKYYGEQGSTKEVRGGGVFRIMIEKEGAVSDHNDTCSGIELANAYRSRVQWCETFGPGIYIGCSIAGRGSGDADATAECVITQNRFRNNYIGIRIKPEESGANQAAKLTISNNNLDGNIQSGLWMASFDGVLVEKNTITTCGYGSTGSGLPERANIYVEPFGITPRNLEMRGNEIGNNIEGLVGHRSMVIVDGISSLHSRQNRFIRNPGEFASSAFAFGFNTTAAIFRDIVIEQDYIVATNEASWVFLIFGGSNKTYVNPVEIRNLNTQAASTVPSISTEAANVNVVVFDKGIDRRERAALVTHTGSGTITVNTTNSLHLRANVNAAGGTNIAASGTARAGDQMVLEIQNSSGGATATSLSTGFTGTSPTVATGTTQRALFRHNGTTWQQMSAFMLI